MQRSFIGELLQPLADKVCCNGSCNNKAYKQYLYETAVKEPQDTSHQCTVHTTQSNLLLSVLSLEKDKPKDTQQRNYYRNCRDTSNNKHLTILLFVKILLDNLIEQAWRFILDTLIASQLFGNIPYLLLHQRKVGTFLHPYVTKKHFYTGMNKKGKRLHSVLHTAFIDIVAEPGHIDPLSALLYLIANLHRVPLFCNRVKDKEPLIAIRLNTLGNSNSHRL